MTILLETWQNAIIVCAVALVVIYLILIYFAVTSLGYFKNKLKSSKNALKLCIAEEIYLVEELYELAGNMNLKTNALELKALKNKLDENQIQGLHTKVFQVYNEFFTNIKSNIFDEKTKQFLNKSYMKLEENRFIYMQITDTYNSDILGYNYWCKFILTRPFIKLLKYKKEDRLL